MTDTFPYPIIFGALNKDNPFPRLNLKTEHGVQKVFSRTKYNLFLDDADKRANLSVGQFIKQLREMAGGCAQCIKPWNCCRLFIDSIVPSKIVEIHGSKRRINSWIESQEEAFPNWDACGMYHLWLSQTQTPAEKRFLEKYLSLAGLIEEYPEENTIAGLGLDAAWLIDFWNRDRDALKERGVGRISDLDNELLTGLRYGNANLPALIPQVWLNWIYDPKLGLADSQREHLHDNPSVVDFVMLHNGKKHIIEIDDPGHYATFDKNQQKYVVSEEEYTKNLRIERRLRWDGWAIHRFSNWEILNSFNTPYILAVLGLKESRELESVGDYLKEDPPEELPF